MYSDSDFSDLSELEDDDYRARPKKKSGKGKTAEKVGYRIRNALKVPRATTYTAQALYDQIHSSDINLEPEYQRDVVWPENKQIGIIDSVFRNFYIPPVIFSVNAFEDGSETKTCIDGKQRLTSIHRFMDGLIPHKDPTTGEKLWYKDVGQGPRARKILPEKYRRLFANKQIVCVEYQDITDSDEREIFQRVQLGMALTPAEKLQVINTPRAVFIRELQSTFLNQEEGLAGDALEWDRSRGSDFRCLSQALFCIEKYPNQKGAGTISQIEKWLSIDEPLPSSFCNKVHDTYRIFLDLVLDKKLNKVFKKPAKISPIEFIMISLLIDVHKDRLSMAQLSSSIGQMRDDVRATHVDIRMNGRVTKTLLEFIKTIKPSNLNGAGGEPAGALVVRKRKRVDEVDTPVTAKKPTTPASKPPTITPRKNGSPNRLAPTIHRSNPPTPSASGAIPDRIAAVRAAKSAVSQRPPPSAPAAYRDSQMTPNNQSMLPSPGVSFSFASQQQNGPHNNPLEASLMASMSRRPSDFRHRQDHPPPTLDREQQDYRPHFYPQDRTDSSHHSWDGDRGGGRDRERDVYAGRPPGSAGFNYPPSDAGWSNRTGR